MTGSSMQRTFKFSSTAAMILLGSCLSILSPTAIAQNEELQKEFQQALQEERSWAGLRSKTLKVGEVTWSYSCLLYTSPSPRDGLLSRMPSSA